MSECEKYIIEIAEEVSSATGGSLKIPTTRWITRPDGKDSIADATFAFVIDGKSFSNGIVLLVSNEQYPNMVGEGVARARSIRSILAPKTRDHILVPLYEGKYGSQTFAAFQRLTPATGNRIFGILQKRMNASEIVSWSASLADQTQNYLLESFDAHFVDPLNFLVNDPLATPRVREIAKNCQNSITKSHRGRLWACVEHGDFWIGNVLFDRNITPLLFGKPQNFYVIDWGGSSNIGYPIIDVIRFLRSIYKPNQAKRLLDQYKSDLKICHSHVLIYVMLGLGRLGENLNQFPRSRFNALCESTLDFLEAMEKE